MTALAGLFALAHGQAHGVEMAAGVDPWGYAAGFLLATAGLLGIGLGLGRAILALTGTLALRATGGAVMLGGLALAIMG